MPKLLESILITLLASFLTLATFFAGPEAGKENPEKPISGLSVIQKNSLLPTSPLPEPKVARTINMIITAYSSRPEETDDDPFITAAGTWVREGIAANNLLPFGTKIRLPEIYGDEIFVIEDRMHRRKGYYHLDIWFPSYYQAKEFGAKKALVEVLEN